MQKSKNAISQIKSEIEILKKLEHVRYLYIFQLDYLFKFVMELIYS